MSAHHDRKPVEKYINLVLSLRRNIFFVGAFGLVTGFLITFFFLQPPHQLPLQDHVEDNVRCISTEYDVHTLELEANDGFDEGYFDFELVE